SDRRTIDKGMLQVTLDGICRVRVSKASRDAIAGYAFARAEAVAESSPNGEVTRSLMNRLALAAEQRVERDTAFPAELPALLRREARDPSRFADLAAARGTLRPAEKDEAVQRVDVLERLEFLAE